MFIYGIILIYQLIKGVTERMHFCMDELLGYIKILEQELYVVPIDDRAVGFNHGARYFAQKVKKYIRNKGRENSNYEVEWHDYSSGKITYHGVYESIKDAVESITDWWAHGEGGHHIIDMWEEDDCVVIYYGVYNREYRIRNLKLDDLDKPRGM